MVKKYNLFDAMEVPNDVSLIYLHEEEHRMKFSEGLRDEENINLSPSKTSRLVGGRYTCVTSSSVNSGGKKSLLLGS